MEKKNTILLTVIAVATLLVAVVGATFAYYSVNKQLTEGTTTYTAKTNKIGSIAQQLVNNNLSLRVTPEDMIKLSDYQSGGQSFWARNVASEELSDKNYESSRQYHDIVKVTLSNGDDKTHYTCTGTIKVAKGTSDSMVAVAQKDDLKLYLKGVNATIKEKDGEGQPQTDITLDLKDLNDASDNTKTYDVVYKVYGTSSTNVSTIQADLELVNRDDDQKDLAGKTLALEITTPTFDCTIDTDTE